jgi:hypothetical protein
MNNTGCTQGESIFKMDAVLVSDARNDRLKQVTEVAIISAGTQVNIIVVESNKEVFYDNVTTIHPVTPFNYNAYLNLGARVGSAEYILFANNDLIFMTGWKDSIISEMEKHGVVSASPYSPLSDGEQNFRVNSESIFGYDVTTKFCGWAFVWKRDFFDKVQGLDEDFGFWCADNSAVEKLKKHNEKHILVTSSLVQHLGRTTMPYLDANLKHAYTISGIEKFNRKFGVNLWEEPYLKNGKAKSLAPESYFKRLATRARHFLVSAN